MSLSNVCVKNTCVIWFLSQNCIDSQCTSKHVTGINDLMINKEYSKILKLLNEHRISLDNDQNMCVIVKNKLMGMIHRYFMEINIAVGEYINVKPHFKQAVFYLQQSANLTLINEILIMYIDFVEMRDDIDNKHNVLVNTYVDMLVINPKFAEIEFRFGLYLLHAGDNKNDAWQHLEHAINLEPNNFDFHYNYGKALIKEGYKYYDRGVCFYKNALKIIEKKENAFKIAHLKEEIREIGNKAIAIRQLKQINIVINHCTRVGKYALYKYGYKSLVKPRANKIVSINVGLQPPNFNLLMNQLQNEHSKYDTVLNKFKLQLYNYNMDNVVLYYDKDIFCHIYCVIGECQHKYKCKKLLSIPILLRILSKGVKHMFLKQIILLLNYLIYQYDSNVGLVQGISDNMYVYFVAKLHEYIGDLHRILAHNNDDLMISNIHYYHSFALRPSNRRRNIVHAKILNQGLNRNKEAMYLFDCAIKDTSQEQLSYAYYCKAMALGHDNQYVDAIENFERAIVLKPSNPRYFDECALMYYRNNHKLTSLQMYYKGLCLCCKNETISNLKLKKRIIRNINKINKELNTQQYNLGEISMLAGNDETKIISVLKVCDYIECSLLFIYGMYTICVY